MARLPPGLDRDRAIAELDAWLAERRPRALKERILPLPALRQVWEGYFDLEGDRQVVAGLGGGFVGPLPYEARGRWLDDHGYFSRERQVILHLWRRMDSIYLEHHREAKDEGKE